MAEQFPKDDRVALYSVNSKPFDTAAGFAGPRSRSRPPPPTTWHPPGRCTSRSFENNTYKNPINSGPCTGVAVARFFLSPAHPGQDERDSDQTGGKHISICQHAPSLHTLTHCFTQVSARRVDGVFLAAGQQPRRRRSQRPRRLVSENGPRLSQSGLSQSHRNHQSMRRARNRPASQRQNPQISLTQPRSQT
jgi:hypothetical protein